MYLSPKIFKAYDIRGIYPTEIDEENVVPIAEAIFMFFRNKLQKSDFMIAVGRDMRLSSPTLFEVVVKTLTKAGANVIDLGLVSTPTFYFAVFHHGFDTGIQITASHNPKEYNGLKFVMRGPNGLIKIGKPTGMEEVKTMALNDDFVEPSVLPGTIQQLSGVVDQEVDAALSLLDNPEIKKFKIVADPANAMAIPYLEALFQKIPVDLVKMNFELDGTFPAHQADPLQASTLVDLQNKVKETNADLGLAPDGDGDRLFFIDEKGEIVPPSIITALVAREMLKKFPGEKILFDIRYIFTPQKIVAEFGGTSTITKVGHAFITEEMNKNGGIFAGESSSHYFFKETGNSESQVTIILTVLKVLSETGKKLSQIVEELRRSYESGEYNFKVTNANDLMEKMKTEYHAGELSTLDGIAITYPDWRFSVRTSNTEPLLRLNVEAYEKQIMEEKRDELIKFIESNISNE